MLESDERTESGASIGGAMSGQTGKPPRWEWVSMDVSIPLRAAEVPHAAETMRTFDLTDEAGDGIAKAMAAVDARRHLVTVRELRYDANRTTEAEARQALERFLVAGADAAKGEAADA
jgi:hypothetical protein